MTRLYLKKGDRVYYPSYRWNHETKRTEIVNFWGTITETRIKPYRSRYQTDLNRQNYNKSPGRVQARVQWDNPRIWRNPAMWVDIDRLRPRPKL